MIISKIEKGDFIYYNLHAEQTVTGTYFTDSHSSGVFDEQFTKSTLDRVLDDVKLSKDKIIVLDFIRLKDISNNLKKELNNISKECKELLFTNITKNIIRKLDIRSDNTNNIVSGEDYLVLYYSNESAKLDVEYSDDLFLEEFGNVIRKKEYTCDGVDGDYHQSSSVYLTKYIDIKKIISKERPFFIYSLYQLAIKINEKWLIEIMSKKEETIPTLVCQNLNTSYIASILSTFLKLDVLILDHIGPINTMYSNLNKKIEENQNYIIVSDVVCLGTEVKIAKTLITFLGGKVYGNVSIVKLDTLKPEHKLKDEEKLRSISVLNVNKGNNVINFQIKTDLE